MLRDKNVYQEPILFRPERFLKEDGSLNPDVQDPMIVFGFGRRFVIILATVCMTKITMTSFYRICPGRHMAMDTILIFIASILSVFDIRPYEDENGEPVVRELQMTSGLMQCVDRMRHS